jgi:Holliday junction resolvasome RuvABC endonuclease subunit
MAFLGIDPGASGGIGVISLYGTYVEKMPDTEKDIYDFLKGITSREYSHIVIEIVHSMPRQGVASSFKFGMSYGALRMAAIASGAKVSHVTPQKWQKELQCLSRGDKNVTKRRAQELFPELKITHATADGILLAEYARRTHK